MIDKSWYEKPEGIPVRHSAGGVVVRRDGARALLALAHEGGYGGLILPKGGIERGETPEEAARREIAEEAGITELRLVADLGQRGRLGFSRRRWIITRYFLYVTRQAISRPTDERYRPAEWYDLDGLPEFFWPEQRELVEENRDRIREALGYS